MAFEAPNPSSYRPPKVPRGPQHPDNPGNKADDDFPLATLRVKISDAPATHGVNYLPTPFAYHRYLKDSQSSESLHPPKCKADNSPLPTLRVRLPGEPATWGVEEEEQDATEEQATEGRLEMPK